MELNADQVKQLDVLEQQKAQVVTEAQNLFPDYK